MPAKGPKLPPKVDKSVDKMDLSLAERVARNIISLQGPENFRADKVADIQSRINAGTYQVSGREVAEKLIASFSKTK